MLDDATSADELRLEFSTPGFDAASDLRLWQADDGQLLAMKGLSAAEEIAASGVELRRWRASAEVVTSSVPGSSTTTVVRVVRGASAGIGWGPSRTGRRPGGHA